MDANLNNLRQQFLDDARSVSTAEQLTALRDKYLGRKAGLIATLKKSVGSVPPDQRAAFGQQVNELSAAVDAELATLSQRLAADAESIALERERVDTTLPGT